MYLCFINLEKALVSVPRKAFWLVLEKPGCTRKFVRLLRLLHNNVVYCIAVESEESDFFTVTFGVQQGCVLAPTMFTLYFAVVVRVVLRVTSEVIHLHFRMDCGRFNLARFKSRSKVLYIMITEIIYADDLCFYGRIPESPAAGHIKFSRSLL